MPHQDDNFAKSTLPYLLLAKRGLPFRMEYSFKMTAKSLLNRRYLIGIEKSDISIIEMEEICEQMEMPSGYWKAFTEKTADANMFFLGYEENQSRRTHKAYLEFWKKVIETVRDTPLKTEPLPLHIGFKWDPADPKKRAISTYFCHPLLPVPGILKRIAALYDGNDDKNASRIIRKLVAQAADRIDLDDSFIYVEVSEEESSRQSFDLNLYKAGMRVEDIRSSLSELFRHYAIEFHRWERFVDSIGDSLLGHISGGIGRNGQAFFTVYYEM